MSLLRAGSALAMPPLAPIGQMRLCPQLLAGRNDRKRSKPGEAASQGSKPQPASGQPGPSPASASGRNPHSARCTSVPNLPRFRALANCRRRLLLGGASAVVARVRNPPHLRRLAGAASMLDVPPKAAIKERIENGDEGIVVSCCGGVRDATRAQPMARALHKKSATR